MSSIEIELARKALQRRGRLLITDGQVQIHHPKWHAPWVMPIDEVSLADPDVVHEPGSAPVPAVFPRVEVVRIDTESPPNLYLVPHHPVVVAGTGSAWCDVVGLAVKRWPTDDELRRTRLRRLPSVDDALAAVYGTIQAPRLSRSEMQTEWAVEGTALTRHGPYSSDARPVARSVEGRAGRVDVIRGGRMLWIVAGVVASLVMAAAFSLAVHYAPDHYGELIFLVGLGVGFAVNWPRTRTTAARSRSAGLLTALLTVAALAAGMLAETVLELASQQGISVGEALRTFPDGASWDSMAETWFPSWWVGLIVGVTAACAYLLGASGSTGVARRAPAPSRSSLDQ